MQKNLRKSVLRSIDSTTPMLRAHRPTALALAVHAALFGLIAAAAPGRTHAQGIEAEPAKPPTPVRIAQASPQGPSQETARTLPTVTVRPSADASAQGLPAPYAGGQVARGSRIGVLGNQDIMDTPFSVTSYTQELIQDQQARSIADVLINDSAVRAARGFGNFQQTYFIRGFPVFSDDVAYNGLYGLVPRQYLATEFVERVEVFRGANTFLSGASGGSVAGGGLGGLINVVPKRATNEPLNRVTLGVQSGGQGYVAADVARRFGPQQATGLRINAARRDGGTGVDREKQELSALAVGIDWRSSSVRLSADVGYQENNLRAIRPSVTPGAGLPIPAAPDATKNFAQPWTYSNSKDTFATARAEWDLRENITAWGAFGVRRGEEANVLSNPASIDTAGNTSAYRFDNTRKETVETGEIGIRGKFRTGGLGHTVTASLARFNLSARNAYAFSNFAGFAGNLYQPTDAAAPLANFFTGGVLSDPLVTERIRTSSFALADTMSFAQDTILLTVGARHQSIRNSTYDYNTGNINGDPYEKSRTTPMAGIVFKASRQVSLYANYIEGLLKGDTVTPVGGTPQVFAPYIARQKEIGAKYDGGSLGASLALFTTDKPTAYLENNIPGQYGEQRNRGIELSVFGQPARGVRVLGGLTLVDAELRKTQGGVNDGKTVIGVPGSQLNVGAEWDASFARGLTFDARVLRTGKQYADAANTQAVPGWTRLDAGARYLTSIGAGKVLTVRARIENLTDKRYWASAGGYPGASYLVVGAPRTFVVSASVDF